MSDIRIIPTFLLSSGREVVGGTVKWDEEAKPSGRVGCGSRTDAP